MASAVHETLTARGGGLTDVLHGRAPGKPPELITQSCETRTERRATVPALQAVTRAKALRRCSFYSKFRRCAPSPPPTSCVHPPLPLLPVCTLPLPPLPVCTLPLPLLPVCTLPQEK